MRIAHRRLRLSPGHQRVAEVAESACRLVLVADFVREGMGLEERRCLSRVDVQHDAAEVDEDVCASAFVPEPSREVERALPPDQRLVVVLREILELGETAVGAGELDRVSEWLEDLDRLERLRPRGIAVARMPVEPRLDLRAAPDCRRFAQRRPLRDRAVDCVERVVEPVDGVRGARQLLERGRSRRSVKSIEKRRCSAIVGVRLAVGVECRCAPSRHERVLRDDVLRARRVGVVDDVGRIGVGCEQRGKDLGVELTSRCDRNARSDRVARKLVAETHVSRVNLEQRRRSGSSAAPASRA